MGFKTVYQLLMDVFPQVDVRMLKAVALEHSKDPDTAVEAVLCEILPVLESKSLVTEAAPKKPEEEPELQKETDLLRRRPSDSAKSAGASSSSMAMPSSAVRVDDLRNDLRNWDDAIAAAATASMGDDWDHDDERLDIRGDDFGIWDRRVVVQNRFDLNVAAEKCIRDKCEFFEEGDTPDTPSKIDDLDDFKDWDQHVASMVDDLRNKHWSPRVGSSSSPSLENVIPVSSPNLQQEVNQLQKSVDSEELILLHKVLDQGENNIASGSIQTTHSQGGKCNGGEVFFDTENEIPSAVSDTASVGDPSLGVVLVDQHSGEGVSHPTSLEGDASSGRVLVDQVSGEGVSHHTSLEGNASSGVVLVDQESVEGASHASLDALDVNVGEKVPEVDVAVDLTSTAVEQELDSGDFDLGISTSPSNITIEALDEIIEAGKDNKRTLFSAMESVMIKMREVELKEHEAEQAEQEAAAAAGLDIEVQVEDLKKMLGHAREANDMHAGEVYGEKAILSTEVKELQARVVNLSEERDSALAVLDEMHRVLEERLAAAEDLLRAAEKEKFDKEESARKALAEQQSIMEKVVHESKILREAAEENSKLREFLMDRGHVVDTLQGEISVICQDVRLLKEKVDNRVPLSQSISSSQTSCILASSGSSARTAPAFGDASILSKHTSPASSVTAHSPRSPASSVAANSSPENVGIELEKMLDAARIKEQQVLDDEWDLVEMA
ncbi:hypothetical protein LINPERHAP1_LOCUS41667 [Linum perenne]